MKTVSIMHAQHNLAAILHEVESGKELAITRRKKIVARLLPPVDSGSVEFPDFAARAGEIWKKGWNGKGTSELVDESRGSF